MSDLLDKNLIRWSLYAPKEAIMLYYVDTEDLQFVDGNLKSDKGWYYTDPIKETEYWFKTLPLNDYEVAVVYGVGLGYSYDYFKGWLKENPKRRLIYFEEDPRVIRFLMETERGKEIVNDYQVELHYLFSFEAKDGPLEYFYWSCIQKPVFVTALPIYHKWYTSRFEEFRIKIMNTCEMKNSLVGEYLSYSVPFFRNFYINILKLPEAYMASKFFGQFKKMPAIICGAGPSLEKQLPQLAQLKDKALIFGGGSSIAALTHYGIQPHFGGGIDPNYLQMFRLRKSKTEGLPFFYRNRIYPEALNEVKGPKLYLNGAGGYEVADYFEKELGVPKDNLEEGHNIINLLIEIVGKMGCDPIILVGMDLGFTGSRTYCPGIVSEETMHLEKDLIGFGDKDANTIESKDIYGKPILTQWKWMVESEWISKYQDEHQKIKLINCTEGGIGLGEIENIPLAEVADKYLTKNFSFDEKIQSILSKAKNKKITVKKITEAMTALKDSFAKCIDYIDIILKDSKNRQKKFTPHLGPDAILAEEAIALEPAYIYVLDLCSEVYRWYQNYDIFMLKVIKISDKKRELEKLKIQIKRLEYLKQAAKVNMELIKYALDHHK